jgi:hypothetical protein
MLAALQKNGQGEHEVGESGENTHICELRLEIPGDFRGKRALSNESPSLYEDYRSDWEFPNQLTQFCSFLLLAS